MLPPQTGEDAPCDCRKGSRTYTPTTASVPSWRPSSPWSTPWRGRLASRECGSGQTPPPTMPATGAICTRGPGAGSVCILVDGNGTSPTLHLSHTRSAARSPTSSSTTADVNRSWCATSLTRRRGGAQAGHTRRGLRRAFLRVCGSITPLFHLPRQLSLGLREVSRYAIEALQRNRRCRALPFFCVNSFILLRLLDLGFLMYEDLLHFDGGWLRSVLNANRIGGHVKVCYCVRPTRMYTHNRVTHARAAGVHDGDPVAIQ